MVIAELGYQCSAHLVAVSVSLKVFALLIDEVSNLLIHSKSIDIQFLKDKH